LDITAFIRELLFGHDCVIVPGFGGFIGNYTPARVDKASATFYPPVKKISFNRNLNHNDGLLIGKISESAKINYGDARNLVEEFAEGLRQKLSKGEKVVFDHIGSFVNNSEGNVQFEPDQDANYNLNSFGLTSFQYMPLEGYDVRKKILKRGEKEPVRQISVRKVLWRAAVIIPLIGVLVAVPLTTDLFKTKVQTTSLNPLASVEFENNREAVNKSKATENNFVLPVPGIDSAAGETGGKVKEEKVLVAEAPAQVFCLIAGSFKSEANASTLMKKLTEDGYTPELLNGPNGFVRVSALRCSDLDSAVQKIESLGKKYPGAWVTRVR
jgi:nucleoid DNA-binding protein